NLVRPWYWPEGGQPHRTEPFTWIVKGKIAASWWPDSQLIERYKKEGIKVIINCSEFDNQWQIPQDFIYFHINIPDFGTPTVDQLERFFDITNKHGANGEAIVVHCVAGCGRTGIMIIAWAAYNGYFTNKIDPVEWIRKIRPCSLETEEQKKLARKIVKKYQNVL
ncbi:MAG: dual specificity protein phosphatase family protein, partial [Promethearchaeota archaeon]